MCLINHSNVKEITHLIVRLCRLLAKSDMKIHSKLSIMEVHVMKVFECL
jgi:hypothetical protein